MKTRIALVAAAALAAAFLFFILPLPAPAQLMPAGAAVQPAVGAIHIHTNRSDGSGSVDEVAAAAASAGLHFIIVTDHGDGTRPPDPPHYRSGVLVIDAVELSTANGHYIAIGMPPAPYRLRGEARDVIDDVKRLGGFGIVAHPHSAKASLRWHDWDAPFDAMEWLNADTEWRDEGRAQLARALLRYPFRPAETLASLLDRPDQTLEEWDRQLRHRRVVAIAGADAHATLGLAEDDASGSRRGRFVKIPSYEASFRTFAIRVDAALPLPRDPQAAAGEIISALRDGRAYSAIDALATPATLIFTHSVEPAGGPVSFLARTNATSGGMIVLRNDGRIVAQHAVPELKFQSRDEGTYRVEVYLSTAPGTPPVPWIVSNPIYVHTAGWGTPGVVVTPATTDGRGIQGGPWHVEKDDGSIARVAQPDPPKGPVEFTYRLSASERSGQYAGLGVSVGNALANYTRVAFRAHASRPMRISLQARRPRSGERWQRSIYVDAEPRERVVWLTDMRPVDSAGKFDPSLADTLLFVVDTVNTLPGREGSFSISDLRVER